MRALTTKQFIARARKVHGGLYRYGWVKYVNRRTKVSITCLKHGLFEQRPNDHTDGHGCLECANIHNTSVLENEWLDSKGISKRNRQKTLAINGKRYRVDAYIPSTRTVYEFYGDYWHGNPARHKARAVNKLTNETFGAMYRRTMKREQELKDAGYRVVAIWEADYLSKRKAR